MPINAFEIVIFIFNGHHRNYLHKTKESVLLCYSKNLVLTVDVHNSVWASKWANKRREKKHYFQPHSPTCGHLTNPYKTKHKLNNYSAGNMEWGVCMQTHMMRIKKASSAKARWCDTTITPNPILYSICACIDNISVPPCKNTMQILLKCWILLYGA